MNLHPSISWINNKNLPLFILGTDSRPTHSILCLTVLSFHTCHPKRNYFPITPPPLPKVCQACPATHSKVSPSNPVFEQTAAQDLSISFSKVSWMLMEQLRTEGIWSDVQQRHSPQGNCDFSLMTTMFYQKKTSPSMASNPTAEYPLKRECRLLRSPVRLW